MFNYQLSERIIIINWLRLETDLHINLGIYHGQIIALVHVLSNPCNALGAVSAGSSSSTAQKCCISACVPKMLLENRTPRKSHARSSMYVYVAGDSLKFENMILYSPKPFSLYKYM